MSINSGQLRQPKGVPIGGEWAVAARGESGTRLCAASPVGLTAEEASERHQALLDAGYVPAVATGGLNPDSTAHLEQWWGDHFVTAEYRASGEGFAQMPDDNTPGMTGGNALSGNRRTHRVKYHGEDVTLRMPSATAIKRFAAGTDETTFDVPVGGQYPDANGADQLVSGWVRVTKSPNGNWTAVGMGFPAGGDEAVAEGVASILEARRPSHALRDAGSLIAKHRARLAAQGAPLQAMSSQWISAVGYDDASGVMATQTANGHIYGHLVSKARFGAVAQAPSPGSMFNKLVKGSERVEVANCPACGRFFSATNQHSCPTPSAPKAGLVRNASAQQYATAALGAHLKSAPAAPAVVRTPGAHVVVPGAKTIDTKATMVALLARRDDNFGRTGRPGWTVDAVADQIAPFTDQTHVPSAYDEQNIGGTRSVRTNGDSGLIRFQGLGGEQARNLLGRLTPKQLGESQNGGPSLGAALGAAARNPGMVEVHGYAVGPDRTDERLTAEGVFIYDDTITDEAGALKAAWSRFGLGDADGPPDEIQQQENPWRPGEMAWRLWWD